jgi:hypothetical protein
MRFTSFILITFAIAILVLATGCASVSGGRVSGVNWALAKNGGVITAFSEEPEHPASTLNNGITSSEGWDNGEGWQAAVSKSIGGRRSGDARREEQERNWVIVEFSQPITLSSVNIYTIDSEKYPAKSFGVSDVLVQYELETALKEKIWANLEKFGKGIGDQDNIIRGNVSGVINVKFKPVTTPKIRVLIYGTNDMARTEDAGRSQEGIARLIEIEAYGSGKLKDRDELQNIFGK